MQPSLCFFRGITVDCRRLTVSDSQGPVALEPKALDVLLFLLAHRDRLVTKEELLSAVWPDTFVTPNVLTRAVAQLRRALGDAADEPAIIETVARRGYRFIAEVSVEANGAAGDRGVTPPFETLDAAAGPRPVALVPHRSAWRPWILGMGVVAVLLIVVLVAWRWPTRMLSGPNSPPVPRQLSTRAGYESQPSLSPDGQSIVYVSDRGGALELYLDSVVSAGAARALTSNGAQNVEPTWSPDGQRIAFHSLQRGGIWVVDANGGAPQQIVEFGSSPSWAPDSEHLVFTSSAASLKTHASLWTVRRDGSDRRPLTKPGQVPGGMMQPSWSHNGRLVAFCDEFGSSSFQPGVFVLSVDDARVHRLATAGGAANPQFAPDDSAVFWIQAADWSFVRAPIDSAGQPSAPMEHLLSVTGPVDGLSISRNGTAAFASLNDEDNLWAIDLDSSGVAGEPRPLTHSNVRLADPVYSPLGDIAYTQMSPGAPLAVWILHPDGKQEALLPGVETWCPEWSNDGSKVFVSRGGHGTWVDLATRHPVPTDLTFDKLAFPRLSPGQREIAFQQVGRDGRMSVSVRPVAGGAEERLAEDPEGVGFPVWSPDGRSLAVEINRGEATIIGLVSRDHPQVMTPIVTDLGNSWPHSWSATGGIAYAGERAGVWNVWVVSPTSHASRTLTHFTEPIGFVRYPTWSARGDRIVFERVVRTSAIWTTTVNR